MDCGGCIIYSVELKRHARLLDAVTTSRHTHTYTHRLVEREICRDVVWTGKGTKISRYPLHTPPPWHSFWFLSFYPFACLPTLVQYVSTPPIFIQSFHPFLIYSISSCLHSSFRYISSSSFFLFPYIYIRASSFHLPLFFSFPCTATSINSFSLCLFPFSLPPITFDHCYFLSSPFNSSAFPPIFLSS